MGGVMSITGWPDSPPTRVGLSMGDITAAVFLATGVNAALFQREKTGLGQKVDVSMLDCQLSILENALVRYQVDGRSPTPLGTRHPTITPFQAFRASDKWFVVAVGNDALWKSFCKAMNRPDLLADPRFGTNGDRTKHYDDLIPELERQFEQKQRSEWLELLEKAGVPAAPVNSVEDVMADRQLAARNMFVTVDDAEAGRITIPGNPIKMETVPESPTRPSAPTIGENTDSVLSRVLGLDDETIASLRAQGVIV
jgi:CoA:oxalate CoA-transferase